MLCFSGFELYSRWVPLIYLLYDKAILRSLEGIMLSRTRRYCL